MKAVPVLVAALIAPLAAPTTATAQVPDGWFVGSAFKQYGYTNGGGGLVVFHPQRTDQWRVTGLPADLTGAGVTGVQVHGANSVLVRPSDGRVFVGELTLVPSDLLEIHEITLTGQQVTASQRHAIGIRDPLARGAVVEAMEWLPDGRVLFAYIGAQGLGALSGLATLDPATGIVASVPITGLPVGDEVNALALDPATGTAYLAVNHRSPDSGAVYAVPVPGGGVAQLVAPWSDLVNGIVVDNDGELVAALESPRGLYRLTPSGWSQMTGLNLNVRGAVKLDAITGDFVCRVDTTDPSNRPIQTLQRINDVGNATLVHTLPYGSEVVVEMDRVPAVRTYGAASPGAYRFALTPSPGGAPVLGNANFGVTAEPTSGVFPTLVVVGLSAVDQPLFGFRLLVGQIGATVFSLSPGAVTVPVPIPNATGLAGLELYVQCLHATGSTLLGSKGLRVTVF